MKFFHFLVDFTSLDLKVGADCSFMTEISETDKLIVCMTISATSGLSAMGLLKVCFGIFSDAVVDKERAQEHIDIETIETSKPCKKAEATDSYELLYNSVDVQGLFDGGT